MKLTGFVLTIIAIIAAWIYVNRPIEYPPGVLIPSEPEQTLTFDSPIRCGDYELKPLAQFALDARACFTEKFIVGISGLRSFRWILRLVGDRCRTRACWTR